MERVMFDFGDDFDPRWQPVVPELACVANSVSLLMPHAEPWVARSVRDGARDLAPELSAAAREFAAEEQQHHAQHRRFNRAVIEHQPSLRHLDRAMAAVFRWLGRRSGHFALGFAAGFETIAYAVARWVAKRRRDLFDGADRRAAEIFWWHLAEEVGHKTVAFDVLRAAGVRRRTHLAGMLVAMVVLGTFAALGTLMMLVHQGRWWRPVAHWRMLTWSIGFTFEMLPAMAISLLPDHHPSKLVDPEAYAAPLFPADLAGVTGSGNAPRTPGSR